MTDVEKPSDEAWKKFVRRHGKVTLSLIGAIAASVIVALVVFVWVLADAQATGLVPDMLGEWTVGHLIIFVLTVILWELVFVASWVIPAGAAVYFYWYRRLPQEEREEYERGSQRGKSTGQDSGFSFFVGLVWLVVVWTTGRWNLAFQSWTINDLVFSWLTAGLVVLLIVGIPGIIYLVWSLRKD